MSTASLEAKSREIIRGSDSVRFLLSRVAIRRSVGSFPEVQTQSF